MTLAPGLLNQRLTFYTREDGGADGFQRPVYVRTGEYWGRLDATADAFTIPPSPAAHLEMQTTAVATVMDSVPVPTFGLVRIGEAGGSGPLYFLRGTVLKRQLRCQQLTLDAVDPTQAASFTVYEGVEVQDGVHLVLPA
jgi:hypothetical protein